MVNIAAKESPKMKTEMLAIDSLVAYANNAKTHPQEQLDKLALWIKKIGFTQPVVIDAHNNIVIGHGRTLAAKQAGLTKVPCVRINGLSEAEVKALRLFDNKAAETGWSPELLKYEIKELNEFEGLDLSLTGFESFEIDALLNFVDDFLPVPVEPAQKPEPATPTVGFKQVQMLFTLDQYQKFKAGCERVAKEKGLNNMTDVVFYLVTGEVQNENTKT